MAIVLTGTHTNIDAGAVSAGTVAVAYTGALTPGSFLVALGSGGANTTLSFADPTNGTWSNVATFFGSGVGATIAIARVQNTASSAVTVTLTYGAACVFRQLIICEFTGIASSSQLDVNTPGRSNSASTTPTDASMTTTVAGDLIIGGIQPDGLTTTPGSGYTLIERCASNVSALMYLVQGSAGAISTNWTSASELSITMSASFKVAAGAPAVRPRGRRRAARRSPLPARARYG